MESTYRPVLKRCLLAMAATIASLLAMQGMAQAAPSAAPKIISQPANPNTQPSGTFTFTVGDGETSTVSPLRYYCRVFDSSITPVPGGLWSACGLSTDAQPLTRTYSQNNGSWTFEVAARESTSLADQGPIASYTWTQNTAAPTMAPIIANGPADVHPSMANKFDFEVDPAETETVTRFECQVDNSTSWTNCVANNPAGITSGSTTYTNLSNAMHRLRVRAANGGGPGAVTTFVWTQGAPAPGSPPAITIQPEDPHTTTAASIFRAVVDPAELNVTATTTMQCRIDDEAWANCSSNSSRSYYPTNGDHVFHARATGPGGAGPEATVEWTVDVPQVMSDTIDVDDIAATRWDGGATNARIGQPSLGAGSVSLSAGDVNGDNVNDLAISDQVAYGGSVQVIFNDGKALGARTMTDLGPNRGFRIKGVTSGAPSVVAVGDQNGDGNDDLLVTSANGDTSDAYVIYGPDDASTLAKCGSGPERCIDPTSLEADQGYTISSSEPLVSGPVGDFDGDGINDINLVTGDFNTPVLTPVVLKGKPRSGTVDLDQAIGVDAIKILGPTGTQFGFMSFELDDLNGDGKDEVAYLGGLFVGSGLYVVTGRSLENASGPIDLNTLEPEDGFHVALPPLGLAVPSNVGDMNNDGRDDLMVGYASLAASTAGEVSIVYMPELPTSDPILASWDMPADGGYMFTPGGANAGLGFSVPLGDIDGDGLGDQLHGASTTPANAFDQSGALYLVKGQQPGVESPVGLGPEFTPDLGVAIVSGKARQGGFGGPSALGDLDGDGLPDFAVTATGEANNGLASAGAVYVVPGKSLLARSVTGNSTVIGDTKATINGQVGTNGRAVEYHFEYGTTAEYGSSTESQSLPAGGFTGVNADLSGLTPNTEYHYRLVVTNELGFNRAGEDRTFTTGETPPPEGCAADSTLPGCPDYDYCKANPGKPECKAPKAKLSSLVVSVGQSKVKRGKKTNAKATIVNTGTAAATGVKVCLNAPKKLVGGAKCVKVGKLGAGAMRTVKFNVKVKKKAKKGKKVTLKFKASANGLGNKSGKATIRVG